MQLRRVRADKAQVDRYITELWIPYNRELGEIVETEGLSDTSDLENEVEWQVEKFEEPTNRLWVALDDLTEPAAPIETAEATFAGFIRISVEPTPDAFAWPDRLVISDLYVTPEYRGGDLADRLITRAAQVAREDGCSELALTVDVDNKRALSYYKKLGFDVAQHRMRVSVEDLHLG
ncbi:MAG: acetyltransferase [Haloquadratum sp. J07HQX50]|nr:MAG: acetyltransferase [Haloquadratum sp. J07HQX50]